MGMIDDSPAAYVQFIAQGEFADLDNEKMKPVLVPAPWFSKLMPSSIFMNIPEDASSISPFDESARPITSDLYDPALVDIGHNLAKSWREKKRPRATTKRFVEQCRAETPAHLIPFAIEAAEALRSGSASRAARNSLATYCELMAHHLNSTLQRNSDVDH